MFIRHNERKQAQRAQPCKTLINSEKLIFPPMPGPEAINSAVPFFRFRDLRLSSIFTHCRRFIGPAQSKATERSAPFRHAPSAYITIKHSFKTKSRSSAAHMQRADIYIPNRRLLSRGAPHAPFLSRERANLSPKVPRAKFV